MSVNNIYLTVATPPVRRFIKTLPSLLSGKRLNDAGEREVIFILKSGPDGFNYEDEVLELYTDREYRYFMQANKSFIERGLIKEYEGERKEVDERNLLSDAEITEIASMRNVPQLTKRLRELDSEFTVRRIFTAATEIGRPAKTLELIKNRLEELL